MRRPTQDEYTVYYKDYVELTQGTDYLALLKNTSIFDLMAGLTDSQWAFSYGPGKWTLKESIVHLMDTERVFAYRALRISRDDKTALAGFDQDAFVPHSGANVRPSADIINEYKATRLATIALFESFTSEQLDRVGTASNAHVSTLALAFLIAGHELHHINLINDRYLKI